jgi:hypothetical protein
MVPRWTIMANQLASLHHPGFHANFHTAMWAIFLLIKKCWVNLWFVCLCKPTRGIFDEEFDDRCLMKVYMNGSMMMIALAKYN